MKNWLTEIQLESDHYNDGNAALITSRDNVFKACFAVVCRPA